MSKKQKPTGNTGRKNQIKGKYAERSRKNGFGKFCLILQVIMSAAFMGVLVLLDMLPLKYLALAALILFFLWCITFTTQAVQKEKGVTGKVYSILLIAVLAVGTYYIAKTNDMIAAITSGGSKVDKMVVAVLKDDPAETLEDASDYEFGVQFNTGAENMKAAVMDIQDQIGDISTTEYKSVQEQAEALISGEVDAIIYNQSYTELMENAVEGYNDQIRIIYKHEIETKFDFGGSAKDDSLTKKPFTVYISGIDTYGDDADDDRDSIRSDVNIIAVVNPTTHQILLITTPRDYYIPIPGISDGMNDKLTHAGTYGIDVSMETLGALYETDINYYVRLNFSSLIEIVDILGGVDVYSEYAFTTGWESGYEMEVQQGIQPLRRRTGSGFLQGRHESGRRRQSTRQEPAGGYNCYAEKSAFTDDAVESERIINEVSRDVETNISQGQLTSLVKSQLKSGAKWTIQSVAASGTDGEDYCYSVPDMPLYVLYPDEEVVNSIVELANIVEEGGSLESGEALN